MSDIVTRLRDYQQWIDDGKNTGKLILDISGDRSCERAADEIDLLRNALEAMLNDASHTGKWNSHGDIELKTWDKACRALGIPSD